MANSFRKKWINEIFPFNKAILKDSKAVRMKEGRQVPDAVKRENLGNKIKNP